MSNFITVASLGDLKEGVITPAYAGDTAVALALVDGKVHAFANVCTHDDGPLDEGEVAAGCVVCPRHGARFSLADGKPSFPAASPIAIYQVRVVGTDVQVNIEN